MTSFEPVQAGPYLLPSDPPNLAQISKDISDWAAPRLNMRFATTAAREAAIPNPVVGMECVTGTGAAMVKWLYFNASWRDVTVDPAWITPTLGNGWVQATAPYQTVRYRKTNGMTEIQGMMGGGTSGTTVFTLPAGYCPLKQENFATYNSVGLTTVTVTTGGLVIVTGYSAGGTNALIGLGGIRASLS